MIIQHWGLTSIGTNVKEQPQQQIVENQGKTTLSVCAEETPVCRQKRLHPSPKHIINHPIIVGNLSHAFESPRSQGPDSVQPGARSLWKIISNDQKMPEDTKKI